MRPDAERSDAEGRLATATHMGILAMSNYLRDDRERRRPRNRLAPHWPKLAPDAVNGSPTGGTPGAVSGPTASLPAPVRPAVPRLPRRCLV